MMVARLKPLPTERIALNEAAGRVLAEQVRTDRPSPAADASAMDGFAVRIADVKNGAELPVIGEARIGQTPPSLLFGSVVRIVTGGPVPRDADTVIRREDVDELDDRIVLADPLPHGIVSGANIRREGENAASGVLLAESGTVISPALAGGLATVGCASPLVHRRVRVGLLITGDEVFDASEPVTPYQLRDSNGPALTTLLSRAAWIEVIAHRRVSDDREQLRDAVVRLLSQCDALLLTGGVSMGNRDFVPSVLEELGAETIFHRVPQRPGKPALGAIGPDSQAILALPGNPVSVLVTARRIAMAVLQHCAGIDPVPQPELVVVKNADDTQLELWHHRLVRLTAPGECELVSSRGSGDIIAAATSDGFIEIPSNCVGCGPWPLYRWNVHD